MTRITKLLVVALAVAALAPAAAAAQSSTEGYGGPNNVVAGVGDDGGPTSGDTASSPAQTVESSAGAGATLPFTGADLGILVAAGAMLLALGFGLRRLTYRPSDA